jgi:dTDP-4-dehydrorhamnose 3,5-epimerase
MGTPIVRGKPIADVVVESRDVKADLGGAVLHHLRVDSPHFTKFGEVYCSTAREGAIKAWKRHRLMTQRLVVPVGRVLFVVHDDRTDSSTQGEIMEIEIGREAYGLLILPPMVWYGFKNLVAGESLIVNCADLVHDPAEVDRLDARTSQIPYIWS